jgi:uncharacterized spore protein YtfJ
MDVQELLAKMGTNLSVSRAFGTAYEKEDTLIIPVAVVAGGGGGGEGTRPRPDVNDTEETDAVVTIDSPSGSGGGFGGLVLPIGAYVVKDGAVRWIPAVSANVVIFAVLAVLRLLLRSRRRSHWRGH